MTSSRGVCPEAGVPEPGVLLRSVRADKVDGGVEGAGESQPATYERRTSEEDG